MVKIGKTYNLFAEKINLIDDTYHIHGYISSNFQYKTSHIFWTMGSDFQFTNANVNFKNIDKIMKYVNDRWKSPHNYNISANEAQLTPINALYSTPSCYLKALNDDKTQTWPTKSDDFFPYASDPHAFWTGYFTSR